MKNTKHRPDIMGSAFTSKNWNYDRGPRVFLFLSIEPGTTKYLPTPSNLNLSIKKKLYIHEAVRCFTTNSPGQDVKWFPWCATR